MQNMAAADSCNWQQWTREDVAQWLESLSLGKYRQVRLRCVLLCLSVCVCVDMEQHGGVFERLCPQRTAPYSY